MSAVDGAGGGPGAIPPEFALDGLHHVTAITADAQANLDFYVGWLGLRLVKRSINQGNPRVYHLFYGDEAGRPGADITFFAYPRLPRGQAGAGMVHRVIWRLGSVAAVDFWERRLGAAGLTPWRDADAVVFRDPDGLVNELRWVDDPPESLDEPLVGGDTPRSPPRSRSRGSTRCGPMTTPRRAPAWMRCSASTSVGVPPARASEARGPHRQRPLPPR